MHALDAEPFNSHIQAVLICIGLMCIRDEDNQKSNVYMQSKYCGNVVYSMSYFVFVDFTHIHDGMCNLKLIYCKSFNHIF